MKELTREQRIHALNVLASDERGALLAWICGWAPEVFDEALAARSAAFADELAARPDPVGGDE
jgi:hypothetical protein